MKIKLQPHHLAEIAARAWPDSVFQVDRDIKALLEHIDAIEEELREANAFLASLPPIQWRTEEEVRKS